MRDHSVIITPHKNVLEHRKQVLMESEEPVGVASLGQEAMCPCDLGRENIFASLGGCRSV